MRYTFFSSHINPVKRKGEKKEREELSKNRRAKTSTYTQKFKMMYNVYVCALKKILKEDKKNTKS